MQVNHERSIEEYSTEELKKELERREMLEISDRIRRAYDTLRSWGVGSYHRIGIETHEERRMRSRLVSRPREAYSD